VARVPQIYICGALRTRFAERIIRRTHALSNVTVIATDLDDEEVGLHVAALDVGIVPYHEYLNSGWTLLALSGGLPIIASHESTAREVVPPAALIEYSEGDARSLAHAIAQSTHQSGEVSRAAALARAYEVHPDFIAARFAQEIAARVFAK
jgi:glycosyltransferase involved in cell wall biosynthesis